VRLEGHPGGLEVVWGSGSLVVPSKALGDPVEASIELFFVGLAAARVHDQFLCEMLLEGCNWVGAVLCMLHKIQMATQHPALRADGSDDC